jgi:hypothetical protein|tara:strand:+ start:138 stop:416 length:279 start_codon:yes stop_codon:yes gene_type:complete
MKYNRDIVIEDTRDLVLDSKDYKKTFPKFIDFKFYKDKYEKSFTFKIGYYRLIISFDRFIELNRAKVELDSETVHYKKSGTDNNIISIGSKK